MLGPAPGRGQHRVGGTVLVHCPSPSAGSSHLWVCSSPGVDNAESECGLDQGVTFDWVITNDGDELSLDSQLEKLLHFIYSKL